MSMFFENFMASWAMLYTDMSTFMLIDRRHIDERKKRHGILEVIGSIDKRFHGFSRACSAPLELEYLVLEWVSDRVTGQPGSNPFGILYIGSLGAMPPESGVSPPVSV
ncbi:hypothetical protein TWF191_000639 [Orbilia oligospora]|uniref:Uncharacterized protein n=2 Tax=Orbilia oligospora TaxID=2813651 RepID=A0A7C8UCX2_ORBOL|nr:hypothetical protein TWF191_000639 [Orbilia oligospora]KAF3214082.1 hypothetical protein TWF679_004952 [Orbilia oligospora]